MKQIGSGSKASLDFKRETGHSPESPEVDLRESIRWLLRMNRGLPQEWVTLYRTITDSPTRTEAERRYEDLPPRTEEEAHADAVQGHHRWDAYHYLRDWIEIVAQPLCACGQPAVGLWRRNRSGVDLPVCRQHWSRTDRVRLARVALETAMPGNAIDLALRLGLGYDEDHLEQDDLALAWLDLSFEAVLHDGDNFIYRAALRRYRQLITVRRRRASRRNGRHATGRPRRDLEQQVQSARKLIADGMSLRSAAKRVGCSPATLSRRLREGHPTHHR